jgi:hypothetical protein
MKRLTLVQPAPQPPHEAWRGLPHDPTQRGYVIRYKAGCECPGCGRSNWHVGRATAECAFCATALPLPEAVSVVAGRRA